MKDWEKDAWVSFASAALAAAAHDVFRPMYVADRKVATEFAEQLAALKDDGAVAVIPGSAGDYEVRTIGPNTGEMVAHCGELADAMLAQLRKRVEPR